MGAQYNKVLKRKRLERRIKRKRLTAKKAGEAKAAAKVAKPAEPVVA